MRVYGFNRSLGGVGHDGQPLPMDYINMVCSGMLRNCPVTPEAVKNTNSIFGADISSLKFKTTRNSPDPVVTEYVEVPQMILYLNRKVTLTADVMFVNGLDFFVRTSRRIKITTLEYIPKRTKGILISSLNKVISIYNASVFNIRMALTDRDFDCMIPDFPSININPTATRKHVLEIEWQIRVIRERAQSICINITSRRILNQIIIELLKFVVM